MSVAVARWQHSALAAARRPVPSNDDDLRGAGQAAGALVSLAQVLLRAHDGPAGPYQHEPARTVTFLQDAGKSWNTAASSWGALRTSTPPDPELQAATADLRQTVACWAAAARSGRHVPSSAAAPTRPPRSPLPAAH